MTNALSLSSKMNQPELSIVIPFLNEERVLPLLRERLEKLTNRPAAWELVFVSDGSTDGSTEFIEAWAQADPSVKLIVLTRNFGHQSAISAGLFFAAGKYVGIMDADLQDEPEILLEMYQVLLAEKVDVVYAVRRSRHETKVKRFFYFVFYRLYLFLADSPVQLDSGDFCVMSRRAVQLLLSLPERRYAVFIQKTAKASFFRTHVFFNKAIEGRTLMRQPPLPGRDRRRVDLCRACSIRWYSLCSARVLDASDHSALFQWLDLPILGDSW
jgi:glycosyltransferase involved in cell wall biosynthesis